MRGFVFVAIIMVTFAFVFHMIFIMFDYAYYHPENGIFNMMPERFNETLNTQYQNSAYNQTVMLRQAFGMGRFLVLGIGVVCGIISVVDYASTRRIN